MDPERWQTIEELFAEAAERPLAARAAFVAAVAAERGLDGGIVAEVLTLLEHDVPAGAPLPEVDHALAAAAARWVADREPALHRLGPYRLIEVLGEGGMGTVWLAERDDAYHQRVAIKVSRAGALSPAELARFRVERQILAQLEHPAIARLLDGGETAEGLPYLVMELVEGAPLLTFAREHGLDTSARLHLFLDLCDAVEHAHRRLVVHRDLKPSNLLVTADGRAKLVDFGIAKLLGEDGRPREAGTALHQRYYTAGYASPEQVRGEPMTTASDVYSLGVVLAELLTGERPTGEAPTARTRGLDRDLGWIVDRARAEELERRYGSVAAFATDLRRWLSGLPVEARPTTLRYRAGKFVARHRFAVTAATVVLLALLGFVVALARQNERIERERDRARQAEAEAQEVAAFLTRLFATADPRRSGGEAVTARRLLDEGAALLEKDTANPPEVRAALLRTMAIAYRGLGLDARGIELATEALALQGTRTPTNEIEIAKTLEVLGDGLRNTARYREAEPHLRQVLEIRSRRLAPDDLDLAETLNDVGLLELQTQKLAEARGHLEAALAIRRRHAAARPTDLAVSLSNLAQLANEEGRLADAEALNREALELRVQVLGAEHPLTANSLHGLGRTLERLARYPEAEALIRQSIAVRRQTLGADHPDTAMAENSLASLLQDQGRLDEAEALYLRVLAVRKKTLGERHLETGVALNNLASLYEERGRWDDAAAALATALAIREEVLGPENASVARGRNNLGRVLAAQGKVAAGLELLARAEAQRRALLPASASELAQTLTQKARILRANGREAEAVPLYDEAVALQREALDPDHPVAVETRAERAPLAERLAAGGDCRPEVEAALATLAAAGPAFEPALARARLHHGDCLVLHGQAERAREAWSQALAFLQPRYGRGNRWVVELIRRLG
jgi:serine/threonine-protein kinase